MTHMPRLLALLLTLPVAASASNVRGAKAWLGGLAGAKGAPIVVRPGSIATALNPAGLAPLGIVPMLAAPSAPLPSAMTAAPAAAEQSPLAPALVMPGAAPTPFAGDHASVSALDELALAAAASADGGKRFDGGRAGRGGMDPLSGPTVKNDEGVLIRGRAGIYYQEVRRLVALLQGRGVNLGESLDVMDDSYSDVWAKLAALGAVAKARLVEDANTHLEETLMWVDGVIDQAGKKIAVHTHRAYFHKGPAHSEIREGIRRLDGYLKEAERNFAKGGKAEQALGDLDEVELVFDVRGYDAIKQHLKKREAELAKRLPGRFKFRYLDELVPEIPREVAQVRSQLNGYHEKYKNSRGLSKIYEGVIYSRYVGLLLELKAIEHYNNLGYTILQSGRELFDAQGHYVTELDLVVRSPEGKIYLVEAKSARVTLEYQEVLRDKVERKLDVYRKHVDQLEKMIGAKIDGVVFAMDVGPNTGLISWLESKMPMLIGKYRFRVKFLFLESGPERKDEQQGGGSGGKRKNRRGRGRR